MNIDSDKVEAFYELAKAGTFLKAAEALGITQPALSKKIARLEDELESTLFIRGAKETTLTEAGLELLRYYKIKKELDSEVLSKISSSQDCHQPSEVRISTYSSIGRSLVLPVLSQFKKKYKPRFLRFSILEVQELETELFTGNSNIIFTPIPITKSGVICEPIGIEELVHISPFGSHKNLPFLDHDEIDQTTFEFLKQQSMPLDITRHFYSDIYGIIDAVKLGLGQAIVSKHLIVNQNKICIHRHKRNIKSSIYMCYFKRNFYPKYFKELISLMMDNISFIIR